MKKLILCIICFLAASQVYLFPQAGTLDNTFSGDGKFLIEFGNTHDNGYTVIPQADMTSVVYGGSIIGFTDYFGTLFKLEENGDIDSTFGADGAYTQVLFGDRIYARNMVQQTDGKFVVSGTIDLGGYNEKFFAARYNIDGTHDNTFNTTGYFSSNYSSANSSCDAIAIQADGKIVLAGRTYEGGFSKLMFVRLNSDGSLDTGFGTNGYTVIDESTQDESINSLAFLSDGTIIGSGYAYVTNPIWGEQLIIAKLDQNGNPINSFGGNGVLIPSMMERPSYGHRVVVRNDSLFVTGAQYSATSNQDLILIKMDSDANGDPAFGIDGIVLVNVEDWNYGFDLILQNDGKIIVGGSTGPNSLQSEFLMLRFMSDGSFDNTWDGDGIARTDFRVDSDEIYSIGMQADGKVIAAGFSLGLNSPPDEGNQIPIARYLNDYTPFLAEFSASDTLICAGNTVTFTDESVGSLSRTWTFEGGSPASSTQSNPTITYNSAGIFNVTLEAYNGTSTSIVTETDYITVIADLPELPGEPVGPTTICETETAEYTISSVQHATSYEWKVTPAEAGTISGTGTTGYFTASDAWFGMYTVKARGVNVCDNGPWSPEIQCESFHMPEIYWMEGEGGYCTGSGGAELILDNSEVDVDYELYLDGVGTGNIVAGTGSPISFGQVSDEGTYIAKGFNSSCSINMNGQVWVHEVLPPGQPDMPSGPEEVCGMDTSFYYTNHDPDITGYTWTLTPPESGSMIELGDSVQVIWEDQYSGAASLDVYATNDCGDSQVSDPLSISVHALPTPGIVGSQMVCANTEEVYYTNEVSGNIYTWVVEGGIVTSGAGTYEITVEWGDPGSGSLVLTELSPEGCSTITDPYEVTIEICPSIGEHDSDNISIIPNPTKGSFSIIGIEYEQVKVYDFAGTIILDSNNSDGKLNIEGHPSGMYLIQVICKEKVYVKRIVLE